MSEPISYIEQTFKEAGITPAQLKTDPTLIDALVRVGMRVTRGQANPHILRHELEQRAGLVT